MPASFSAQFTYIDWLIVVGYFVLATTIGIAMAGKQATIRDFFLAGRKLPWYAVSGSIIATEISAVTFISVPFVVFKPGGNLTYLQLGIFGSLLARVIVGYVLVPAYYKREIYSPYDYMGNQLGGNVRAMTTALFTVGTILAQSARIYLTAEVMIVVMNAQLEWLSVHVGFNPLAWAIILQSGVSVAWTLVGGMSTVVWTDVLQFLCFVAGAAVALGTVIFSLDGGFSEMIRMGLAAGESGIWGKLTFFDFSTDPTRTYTIWAAVIASTWGGLGSYGTDQLLAQRIFCCRNEREARWAIVSSAASQFVTITVAFIGIGLYAYYLAHPMDGEARRLFEQKGDRILPIFVLQAVPQGLRGLIIAAVFAAAVSTGVLTALSQTVMSAFYVPMRERFLRLRGRSFVGASSAALPAAATAEAAEDRLSVLVGRISVVFWGIALSGMAYFARQISEHYPSILDLALAMATYIAGALLAGFALAFLPLKIDGRGFMFSGPLSALFIFALAWHQPWTHALCWAAAGLVLALWLLHLLRSDSTLDQFSSNSRRFGQTLFLAVGLALMICMNYVAYWTGPPDKSGNAIAIPIAWPWYPPIGSLVAFTWGYFLARRRIAPIPSRVTDALHNGRAVVD